jgi:sugar fermentation stimulation protein A
MDSAKIFFHFPRPQRNAIFINRPQRFLARMIFEDGEEVTVYCANPGAMTGLLTEGQSAVVWDSENSQRSRRYTWRAIKFHNHWVGTDTHLSNRVVEEIIRQRLLPVFHEITTIEREKSIDSGVRIDFIVSNGIDECLIEVKSVSIVLDGTARFPDSKTPRGIKQLIALTRRVKEGQRAILLFLVQRADVRRFVVTDAYDPQYAKAFVDAVAAGLEVIPVAVKVTREGFSSPRLLPFGTEGGS